MRHQSDDVRAITSQMAPIFIVYCLQTPRPQQRYGAVNSHYHESPGPPILRPALLLSGSLKSLKLETLTQLN